MHYSRLRHVERTNVNWGGYSLINAELLLLKASTSEKNYQRYHLLSGADLPIKTQNEIIKFFAEKENEFVRFEHSEYRYSERTQFYHPFQEIIGHSHNLVLQGVRWSLLKFQQILKVHRNREIKFQKGTNWFSITDNLARYVVSKEMWIRKVFKNTSCADEVFLQTIIDNSDFKNNLYYKKYDNDPRAIMRLIDWQRGKPYIFRECDFQELMNYEMLFARKFDAKVDSEIVIKIRERLLEINN